MDSNRAASIEAYRRLALSLPDATELGHMGHPDFRVGNKIFATLWPDEGRGVLLLQPEQQAVLVDAEPTIFSAVPGGWGRRGSTIIHLDKADSATMASALAMAWRNRASKQLVAAYDSRPRSA